MTDDSRGTYASIAMLRNTVIIFLLSLLILSCDGSDASSRKGESIPAKNRSPLEKKMIQLGLLDVRSIDPSLIIDLKYSSRENFLRKDVYGDLDRCYLQREVALMLKEAHKSLRRKYPRYRFIVYDGARPRSVQKTMWEMVRNTKLRRYVANPTAGSNHNFGAAVDLSIVEIIDAGKRACKLLDMGTGYDHLGPLTQPRYERRHLRDGLLSQAQIKNRRILRDAMMSAGFRMIGVEWWHFNAFDSKEIRRRYPLIE